MHHTWYQIKIDIDYGYLASYGSVTITCYNDGDLIFEGEPRLSGGPTSKIIDRDHSISKASLKKIDDYAKTILTIDEIKLNHVMDGPSFDCMVHYKSGIIKGFGYVSALLAPELEKLEKDIRKILREDFFLKKHEKALNIWL